MPNDPNDLNHDAPELDELSPVEEGFAVAVAALTRAEALGTGVARVGIVPFAEGATPVGQGTRGTAIGHQFDHEEGVAAVCGATDGTAELVRAFLLEL